MDKKLKIIIWDIETSLEESYTFHLQRKYGRYIPYKNIISHWHFLCVCWKELGSNKTHSVSLLDDPVRFKKNHHDDYHVIKHISDVLRDADVLIAHNGDKFDLKSLNARLAFHNLPPLPKILTIDTLKKAKQIGEFPANSLDSLGDYFGLGKKIKTDFDLWVNCYKGDKKALAKMVKYCKEDVRLNERVYQRLLPYMTTHPNLADIGTRNCPRCNSSNIHKHKIRIMASGRRKQQMHCQSCGGYHTHAELIPDQPFTRV